VRSKFILGLDIGTTKVSAVVGTVVSGRPAEIIGMGLSHSSGLRKGVVVDIEAATDAIRDAVGKASESSGVELNAAYIGVAGGHVKCHESYGATGIKGSEVRKKDIERVIESAAAVYVPLDREVLHVIPSDFIIDGQDGIVQPIGMSGVRLEANVNVITASHAAVENLMRCCEKAGLRVIDRVFEPIASCRAAVRADELDSGVVVVDMGGGTTDVAVYKGGVLRHASVLPVGGNHFTNDIAIGLRISHTEAERIKKKFGYAVAAEDGPLDLDVVGIDGTYRRMPGRYLSEIILPRCEEMFGLIAEDVRGAMLYDLPSFLVLTGGASLMKGMDRVAEASLGLPVRIGMPEGKGIIDGLRNPIFSTSVGLLLYGLEEEKGIYDELLERMLGKVRTVRKYMLNLNAWGFGSGSPHAH
jgi:cell division protein FtsA